MKLAQAIGSLLLLGAVGGGGYALAEWKRKSDAAAAAAAANFPEPMETVAVAEGRATTYRRTISVVGTVKALRWISVRNETPGTVRKLELPAGAVVQEGAVLVALDASVEEAELRAQEARAALAESTLARMTRAGEIKAASELEVDRARAERDAILAEIARTKAVIAKKTVHAPFKGKVGLSEVQVGQYLDAGATLTTLQSVDDASYVEFSAPQEVAAGLKPDDVVEAEPERGGKPVLARIVAIDALVDEQTRNATVRARLEGGTVAPGSAVRVRVPAGAPRDAVAVPADALRRGPEGDHVYAIGERQDGKPIARRRAVVAGPLVGDEFLLFSGLKAGERVAAAGSFKLYEGLLVNPVAAAQSRPGR